MKNILYLKAGDKHSIGMKLSGVRRSAALRNWHVQTVDAKNGEFTNIPALMDFWKPDGVIVDCGDLVKIPPLRAFRRIPVVFLGRFAKPGECIFTVCENLKATAVLAAKELLALDFPDYGFVGYHESRRWSKDRERHFREAIELNGKRFHVFNHLTGDALDWSRKLSAWLHALPRPCGLFCANDDVASRVLDMCAKERIAVPADMAVLGVDNDEAICETTAPRLSSVLSDFETSGTIAARLLAARFHSPRMKPAQRYFPPLMVIRRESTRHRRGISGKVAEACELIREQACEGLRARDVAAIFPCSRRLAEIRFREATGHSILEEIQRIRFEKADALLATGRYSIATVANMCGYSSDSAFRRLFRQGTSRRL